MQQKLKAVLLVAALAGTQASSQAVRFETYSSDTLTTAEGTFKLPFQIGKVKVTGSNDGQFDKAREVTKAYVEYMQGIANAYMGKEKKCYQDEFFFLPGSTETAFRASEKALHKTLTVNGYKRSTGEVGKYVTKKTIPVKTLSDSLTGSFYIYKPSVYPKDGAKTEYVYGFFFDKKLKQGSMISCNFFNK